MKFLLRKNRAKTTVVKFDSFSTVIPEVVEKSIDYLLKNGGLELEGIFRIPGNFEKIRKLKTAFDKGKNPSFSKSSLNEVAGVLKIFFIELPEPLLTFELYDPMVACLEGTQENKLSKLHVALALLPPLNRCILTRLMGFLHEVGKKSDKNKMTFSNLALIFGPHLLRSKKSSVPVTQENFILYFISTSKAVEICNLFLNHFDTLFSMDKRKSSSHSAPGSGRSSSESVSESSCSSSVDQSSFKRKVKRATISLASSLLQEAEEMRNPTMDISFCVGEQTLKNPSEQQVIEEKRLKFQESIIAVLLRQQSPDFKTNKSAPLSEREKEDEELENQIEQWLVDFNKRANGTEINMLTAVKTRTKSSKSRTDSVSSRTSSSLFSTPSLSDLQSEDEMSKGLSPKRMSARHGKEPSTPSPLQSPKYFVPRTNSEKIKSEHAKNSCAEETPSTPNQPSASIFKSTSASQADLDSCFDVPSTTSTTSTTTTTTGSTNEEAAEKAAADASSTEKNEIPADQNSNSNSSATSTTSTNNESSSGPTENITSPHNSEPNTPTSASSKRTYTTSSRELTTPKLPSAQQILHSRSASSRARERSEKRQIRVESILTPSSPKVSPSIVHDQPDTEDMPPVTDEVLKVASYIRQGRMKDAKKYIIKQTFKDGSSFEGSFDDDGNYHGFGRFVYADGNTYEGDYVHGFKEGQGRLLFKNGDSYVGGFCKNERHGWGTYSDAQGNVYEGEYLMGIREGRGEFSYQGSKYVGDFKGGVPHGNGKFFFSSGDIYEGGFVENVMHGKGKYKDTFGNSYDGDYFKGKRTGRGLFINAKGNRYEGDFVDGAMSGKGVYTFVDGDRYEGDFANGKFNGQGTYFFASKNQSLSGTFKDGKHLKQ